MVAGRLRGAVTAVALTLAALAPASAAAAVGQPIALGAGQNPNVTVEADGTAHVAYTGAGASSAQLRGPRGSLTIPLPLVAGS